MQRKSSYFVQKVVYREDMWMFSLLQCLKQHDRTGKLDHHSSIICKYYESPFRKKKTTTQISLFWHKKSNIWSKYLKLPPDGTTLASLSAVEINCFDSTKSKETLRVCVLQFCLDYYIQSDFHNNLIKWCVINVRKN